MAISHYSTLDKIIEEYETDRTVLKPGRTIIEQYPKIFVMSIVSSFEVKIKELIKNIITNPSIPLATLPVWHVLIASRADKQVDNIYGKLQAYDDISSGSSVIDALPFYSLFGGNVFKQEVINNFNTERARQLNVLNDIVKPLEKLIETTSLYDDEYTKQEERREHINNGNFQTAELAFLSLKLRRNRVAHNYLFGLSDSFEDVRNFYYEAVIYVTALEQALKDKSTI